MTEVTPSKCKYIFRTKYGTIVALCCRESADLKNCIDAIRCTKSDDPYVYQAYLVSMGSANMLTSLCEDNTSAGSAVLNQLPCVQWIADLCLCLSLSRSATVVIIFTARGYAKRGICRRRVSVRRSVCVSVTFRYCIKTAKRRITQIMPHDRVFK